MAKITVTNMFNDANGYFAGGSYSGLGTNNSATSPLPGDGSQRCRAWTGNGSASEAYVMSSAKYALDPAHIYYFAAKVYFASSIVGSFDFYWPVQEPSAMNGATVSAAKTWQKVSARFERTGFAKGSHQCRFDWNHNGSSGVWLNISGMMLVDLTAAFGAGQEPSKEWCDANIPWCASTTTLDWYPNLESLMTDIAAAIKAVDGTSGKIYGDSFPARIRAISERLP